MILNFLGKTAAQVSCPYGKELSCKKSRKSLEPNKWFGMLQQVEANHNSRTHCDSNQLCTTRPLTMQLQAIAARQLRAFARYGLRTVHNATLGTIVREFPAQNPFPDVEANQHYITHCQKTRYVNMAWLFQLLS